MKLTKKLETEVLKTYHSYWESYTNGDIKTFAGTLDKTFEMIGTTESEICHTREDGIKFMKAQVKELLGKVQMRNRKISLVPVNEFMLVNEQCDIYFLNGRDWSFYSKIRISTFLRKTSSGWKVFQQHGSLPDMQVQEGETLAVKKISKENFQLKEAIKRRTVELEQKNRELEVETALEKVRAVALGMKKAEDMLSICKTISQQLAKLGVKEIRNVQTAIFNVPAGTYMNYEFYAKHDKTFITETLYTNHKVARAFAAKMLKGKGEVSVTHIKGKEKVKEWLNYQKGTNVFIDTYLNKATSLTYYWFSLGPVALGISTYLPLSKEDLQLFQRFLKVFELAYRRYLDIQKAEVQAREAQIEAALERIRARALAMHSSDEFTDVARVMREQMGQLGQQELETSAVHLYDEDAEYILSWRAFRLSSDLKSKINYGFFKIPKNSCKIAREFVHKFKSKATDYTTEISGAMQTEWYKILFKLAPEVQAAMKKSGTTKEKRYYHFSKFSGGSLLMVSSKEPSSDAIELQKRAAQVFDLAYRRFKDLQKAEAQAREAQIEAALERIRAASLAMMDSSALGEIIYKLYGELTKLDAQLDRCFIMIVNPENKGITWWLAGKEGLLAENGFFIPMNQHPSHLMYLDYWKKRKKKWQYLFEGKEKRDWDRFGFSKTELARLPDFVKKDMASVRKIHLAGSSDQFGSLVTGSIEPLPEEQQEIISRFTIAFNQAYTRFLDLQKAEAQARESQIQLALERIRARTMAMQKSEELPEAANLLFHQVQSLGMPAWSAGYCIWSDDKKNVTLWMSSEGVLQPPFTAPTTKDELFIEMRKGHEKAKALHVVEMGGKKLEAHYKYMRTLPVVGEIFDSIIEAGHPLPTFQVMHYVYFSKGFLLFITYEPVPESHEIFKRFASVFDQTYTRFLDLQKAEAQAREAQIEAALERVRSRSMAMHKSEELKEVIKVVLEQFVHLNINVGHSGFYIDYKANDDMHIWLADPNIEPFYATLPYFDTPTWNSFLDAKSKGKNFFTDLLGFEEKNKFYQSLFKLFDVPEEAKKFYMECKGLAVSTVLLDNVGLYIENFEAIPYTDEENAILMRFGRVFQQTYNRFLDLQKAEAQVREAQIEAALEKVRSRSLAMHKSDELNDVVTVLFEKLKDLSIPVSAVGISINIEGSKDWNNYVCGENEKGIAITHYRLPYFNHRITNDLHEAREKGLDFFVGYYSKEEKDSFYEYVIGHSEFKNELREDIKQFVFQSPSYTISVVNTKHAMIIVNDFEGKSLSDSEVDILKRFSNVFDQAYTRFLDLQKAEAQAREAQIEAALERVRSRTMAMHKSEELNETAELLYRELSQLGIEKLTCGFTLLDEAGTGTCYMANPDGSFTWQPFRLDHKGSPGFRTMFESWRKQEPFSSFELSGPVNEEHNRYLATHADNFPMTADQLLSILPPVTFSNTFNFRQGYLLVVSLSPFTKDQCVIAGRFAKVFQQTYTRFLDLQKAEIQAREAQIEAALERVRSRTLAMQKSDELAETATEVFRQLISLGIEPNRLYIGIVKEETGDMEMWATDEDGTKVGQKFMFNKNENASVKKLFDGWQAKEKSVIVDMQGNELEDYFHYLNNVMHIPFKGGLTQKRRVQSVAYFSKGFIGMASPDGQGDETIQLLERFAAVFNLTFTRFNDLKIAEAHARQAEQDLIAIKEAKQKAEEALTELQATQKQLIQSEKMASLGELTAGIAHEIQNPLNFVNNFSEVSKELLDEMKEAIEKGDAEEAKEIMNDVIQNLEKINHHGKRADGIVKGMLQHSRSSSNTKEPTDINALCDEYLRLAYHGLRAKDKSFNAKFESHFDESVGKIDVMPQDMGRVVLNLINNSFYAVSERKKAGEAEYEPTVVVSTKKEKGNVIISVRDNGTGIPQKMLDKIFQPFFTTKPTGQGTGLGLSLSYDIVKAHGGDLKVQTKEGEGSEFIIELPV